MWSTRKGKIQGGNENVMPKTSPGQRRRRLHAAPQGKAEARRQAVPAARVGRVRRWPATNGNARQPI